MRVLLKVCGITNWRDAKRAMDAGADMLGFNFYGASPRFVPVPVARRIAKRLPNRVKAVGIFVNEELQMIEDIARIVGLHAVQLHGEESPQRVEQLGRRVPVIKAFRVRPGFRLASLLPYRNARALLLDGFSRKARGGAGRKFDWDVARRARRYGRIFLAGGVTPENVSEAIAQARPYAVDICSGVEAAPGIKDARKLRALGAAMKRAMSKKGTK